MHTLLSEGSLMDLFYLHYTVSSSHILFYTYRSGGGGGERALEQKLFRIQEELTELHKKRGEVSVVLQVMIL